MNGKYISLTTFKRDGTGVATPVWFVQDDGHLFVKTDTGSYKVKRIARNAAVTVAECTASGRLRSETVNARAEVVPHELAERVERMMARKYRIDRGLVLPIYRAVQLLRGKRPAVGGSTFLQITPLPGDLPDQPADGSDR